MNSLQAAPGVIIAKPLKEEKKQELVLTTTENKESRVIEAIVIDVGLPMPTDFGKTITTPVLRGQTVYFLSYEGNYDNISIDNELYYFVLFKDVRGYKEYR